MFLMLLSLFGQMVIVKIALVKCAMVSIMISDALQLMG